MNGDAPASATRPDATRPDGAGPRRNELGQPIGPDVGSWSPPERPSVGSLVGRWVRLERLDLDRHLASLWHEFAADTEGRMWTYLPIGPFADPDELRTALAAIGDGRDLMFYALVDPTDGAAVGLMAYLRIDPAAGSIEVGAIMLSPRVQRTRLATEALFLLADHVFGLGYRRFEWKCDALNERSRRAAERFGFTYEGTFRQATVYKHRSRDTSWFGMLDHEWPTRAAGYRNWLAEENFDERARQRRPLQVRTPLP